MIHSRYFVSAITILFMVFVGSCNGQENDLSPTRHDTTMVASASPSTLTPSPTMISSLSLPSSNFVPTLSLAGEELLTEFLHSANCNMPCYLDIHPGYDSFRDAITLLDHLGAVPISATSERNMSLYEYRLDVGDTTLASATPADVLEIKIIHWVSLVVDEHDIVQQIRVVIEAGNEFVARFETIWSRYSVHEVFVRHGRPDEIRLWVSEGGGYGLIFYYEEQGIVFEMNGTVQQNMICLGNETMFSGLHLVLTNSSSNLSIFNPNRVPPSDPSIWHPVEDILNVDQTTMYNSMILEPSICFETNDLEP